MCIDTCAWPRGLRLDGVRYTAPHTQSQRSRQHSADTRLERRLPAIPASPDPKGVTCVLLRKSVWSATCCRPCGTCREGLGRRVRGEGRGASAMPRLVRVGCWCWLKRCSALAPQWHAPRGATVPLLVGHKRQETQCASSKRNRRELRDGKRQCRGASQVPHSIGWPIYKCTERRQSRPGSSTCQTVSRRRQRADIGRLGSCGAA